MKPVFDEIGEYSQGLAPAKVGGKWGFIDTCGKWAIEAEYDDVFGFNGGPATVQKAGKWGLIDKSGKEILAPQMAYILSDGWTDGLIAFSREEERAAGPSRHQRQSGDRAAIFRRAAARRRPDLGL